MKNIWAFCGVLLWSAATLAVESAPVLTVLGVAQDGGFPQTGCETPVCKRAFADASLRRKVVSLGVRDPASEKFWLFEATPDLREQLQQMSTQGKRPVREAFAGVFVTHAHMGHYTGLMHLGREAMNAKEVAVYGLPRFTQFLAANGPWQQLVKLNNIRPVTLEAEKPLSLNARLLVTALPVPHRDEYSETAAFVIEGPRKKALFIPDIDKWEKWTTPVEDWIRKVDVAYLDATFFDERELPGRNMAEIPHPFVKESLARFKNLPSTERAKIRFIHFNHSNPLLLPASEAKSQVEAAGMKVAQEGEQFEL